MGEATKGSYIFCGKIIFGSCIIFDIINLTLAYFVYFFILFCSVEITILASSSYCPSDIFRVPGAYTTDLSLPSMCFSVQSMYTESANNTLETVSLCYANCVYHFTSGKNLVSFYFLFKEGITKIDFFRNRATINLYFNNMCLFSSEI